ncbi:hypothetical protein ISN44_As05g053640 [Arabidopsis suecica]|uniref:Membrane lipoprotein n=2 Tax=Arabidopsis TaxID=3701 RepID=A8MQK9_ARATH|nr:Putative membrane lipoprotein [Arabidopsis thaliana]AED97050.2 Putative membrane lipoprotein [Arabidopsis thaliana]KAG7613449.1 hypothetical protein ISN44_As05g053640 [Arabidopsis suecica]|eukprot:NP_001318829.1 Putative membrane lipoprotein [Arabidopsis thaliana]
MAGKMCMMVMVMVALIMIGCPLKACNGMASHETIKEHLWKLCYKNCMIKCGKDNYQCQDHCFAVCDPDQRPPSPPSLNNKGKTRQDRYMLHKL